MLDTIHTWEDFRAQFVPLPTGCWLWIGGPGLVGTRGQAWFEGRREGAYNIGFIVMAGSKDPSMHRDHLCCYGPCCNPFHVEQVTPQENAARWRRSRLARTRLGVLATG
jgi:hypothetical protein